MTAASGGGLQSPSLSSNDTIALIEGAFQRQPQLQSPTSEAGRLTMPRHWEKHGPIPLHTSVAVAHTPIACLSEGERRVSPQPTATNCNVMPQTGCRAPVRLTPLQRLRRQQCSRRQRCPALEQRPAASRWCLQHSVRLLPCPSSRWHRRLRRSSSRSSGSSSSSTVRLSRRSRQYRPRSSASWQAPAAKLFWSAMCSPAPQRQR